jgi:Protein of unknown function (DUF732)
MSKLIKIIAWLTFVSVGLAAPGPPAHADATQDQEFYRLLANDGFAPATLAANFSLMRSHGIAACQREDAGEVPYQAYKDLQYPNGPYTSGDASSISSAAEVIYCPWHLSSRQPVDISAPVYPPPVYPPLAWYPPPVYYPPPGPPGYYPPPGYPGPNA